MEFPVHLPASYYNYTMRQINPYIVGVPIKEQANFFGRQDIFREVMRVLRQRDNNAIVLYGQRRIGKTSVLLQLEKRLAHEGEFTPVYYDLQDKAAKSLPEVLYELSQNISRVTGYKVAQPTDFTSTGDYFRSTFLPQITEKVARGGLVLLFDEFDVIDNPMRTQASDAFFPYLRQWMTDLQKVKFVFVIGRRPEDLSARTMATFKSIQSMRVSFLNEKDAEEMVRQSEQDGSLNWDKSAVQRVIEISHRHPFFTQLLCSVLWEDAYESDPKFTPTVLAQNVDDAVPAALKFGANAFHWIWDGLPPAERVVVAAMAEIKDEIITQDKLIEVLKQSGVRRVARELEIAPETLMDWEVLFHSEGGYRFAVPLLQRWVLMNRPLHRVKDELDRLDPLADSLFQAGLGFYNNNNPDAAEQQLHQALEINPNHLKAHLLLGQVLLEKGKLAESVSIFEKAYQYDERAARADLIRSLLALADSLSEDESNQTEIFQRILTIQSDQPIANEKLQLLRRKHAVSVTPVIDSLNPFIYSRSLSPFEFKGRDKELKDVAKCLRTGQSVAIVGQPHTGKTSLLGFLNDDMARQRYFGSQFEKFYFTLLDIQATYGLKSQSDFWRNALVPLKKISNLEILCDDVAKNGYDNFALEHFFVELSRSGHYFVLLLDEFDALLSHPFLNTPDFYGALRTLTSRSGGLIMIAAARRGVEQLNMLTQSINPYGSLYFNVLIEIQLGALNLNAFTALLDKGGDYFTDTDREYIQRVSGRNPYLAQTAAAKLWDARDEGLTGAELYRTAGQNFYRQVRQHFADTWSFWPNATRKTVTAVALAEIPRLLAAHQFRVSELVDDFDDFSPELDILQVSGILSQNVSQEWIVAQDSLLWWLADELRRNVRDEMPFGDWVRAQKMENLLTEREKQQLNHAAQSTLAVLGKGATTLIESLAKGFGESVLK